MTRENDRIEYIVVGDTPEYKGCLISACGSNRETAEKVVDRMNNNPNEQDKREIERNKYTNIRIEETEASQCWWYDYCD